MIAASATNAQLIAYVWQTAADLSADGRDVSALTMTHIATAFQATVSERDAALTMLAKVRAWDNDDRADLTSLSMILAGAKWPPRG